MVLGRPIRKDIKIMNKFNAVKSGFTIVEILIVVLIVGLLTGLAIPNFITARQDVRQSIISYDVTTVSTALTQAAFSTNASIINLTHEDIEALVVPTYLDSLPSLPGGGTYSTDGDGNVIASASAPAAPPPAGPFAVGGTIGDEQ